MLFVSADWQVRVFLSSGLVDRPSDHQYIPTIFMSGFMDIRSCYRVSIKVTIVSL